MNKKKNKFNKMGGVLLLLLAFSLNVIAQVQVRGTVVDEDGEPVIGATIRIQGTTQGTVTDIDGVFTLSTPAGSTLLISAVGFTTQETAASATMHITLRPDIGLLDELVVVGYGVQRRANLTGAVATVSAQELNSRNVPNTASLLQGRVPGLQVIQNSSIPGMEQVQLRIRGQGSYGSTNDPLVIIDGIEASLTQVNPNMIESITVLKDASSAAIFGARAANGVILVTTKAGQAGALRVEYTFNRSTQRPTTPVERITNSIEFMEMTNKAIRFSGTINTTWYYTEDQIQLYRDGQNPNHPSFNPKQFPNTDWLDHLIRNGAIQEHFLNIHGGSGGTTFNAGLGYLNQEGLLLGTSFERYDFSLNLRSQVASNVTFGTNINMNYSKRLDTTWDNANAGDFDSMGASQDQLRAAYAASPLMSPQLPDGSGRWSNRAFPNKGGNKNPIGQAIDGAGQNNDAIYVLASSFISVELLPGLTAQARGGATFHDRIIRAMNSPYRTYEFLPDADGTHRFVGLQSGGHIEFRQRNRRTTFYSFYSTLNYQKKFLDAHDLNVLGGYSMELYQDQWIEGFRRDYADNTMWYLNAGPAEGQTNASGVGEWALMSYFGRVNYSFRDKYLLEYNMRFDGSSRLHPDNRWGVFPSISAGWRISEEDFFNFDLVDNLRLRGSWGIGGNYGSGNYQYQSMLSRSGTGIEDSYSIGGVRVPFYRAADMANDRISWETTTTHNIGLDFALWNSRIFASIDYFQRFTDNIIRRQQVPNFVGVGGPNVNSGAMRNTGFELTVGHQNRIGDFSYGVRFNFDTYKNTLVRFGREEIVGDNRINREGLPWESFFMLQMEGIYQTQEEIDSRDVIRRYAGAAKVQPGDIRFRDANGDGIIDGDDRVVISGAFPNFGYSLNLDASYKGFDMNMFWLGSHGRKLRTAGFGMTPFNQGAPPFAFWRDHWDGPGSSNTLPHIFMSGHAPAAENISSFFLHDASFLRLKNVQIGYTVPARFTNKVFIHNLRVHVAGDNLLTFSNYFNGQLDPERTARTADAIYPQARIYTVGLRVTF
jgi:TonB-linked SusC/RagA family outer membrane protein